MRLLLDTHTALWWWCGAPELNGFALEAIADGENEIFFSAVSGYEIFQKVRLGKLDLPEELLRDLPGQVRQESWRILPIGLVDTIAAARIDHEHRDPFDRLLAAQCETNGLALVTTDAFFDAIGVATRW